MSPLGFLLISSCDHRLRVEIQSLKLMLDAMGVSTAEATLVAKVLGLTPIQWVN